MSLYLSFWFFSLVASITPGPTNLMAMMIGLRQGVSSAFPFALGAAVSATIIIWLSGLGLANLIENRPWLGTTMTILGLGWINWLALQLFLTGNTLKTLTKQPLLNGWQGAGLQFVNPKTWMMAFSVIGIFQAPTGSELQHTSLLSALFFTVAVPGVMAWSWLGQSFKKYKHFDRWQVGIYRMLAIILLVTV